jgi:very-short-patch-repair endonuclease
MPDTKSLNLLSFLRGVAALRQRRVTKYSDDDKVVYFGRLPDDEKHIKSPFLTPPADANESPPWLAVQKAKMPPSPSLPAVLKPWIADAALADPENEPQLPEESSSFEAHARDGDGQVITLRLAEHPEVQAAWEVYLSEEWRPWANSKKHWEQLQAAYSELDEMRRAQEDGGERYELLLAFGLLQWRTDDESIERHMFVAPAEITLNATRGKLTVEPAGSFERFRLETDMLPPTEAPDLDLVDELSTLDVTAWSKELVAPLLRNAANAWRADAQADANGLLKRAASGRVPTIVFAPALVLRKRRLSTYTDILNQLVNALEAAPNAIAAPWAALVAEGSSDAATHHDVSDSPLAISGDYRFPLPANDEQREILDRLRMNAGVLVKGPPGTGKSHTIANLICHLLSEGHRVLVTAHSSKALAVLRGLLPKEMQNLCVTSMGGSREDQKLLEDSVNSILARQAAWPAEVMISRKVKELARGIADKRRQKEVAEQKLRDSRAEETRPISLPGGYAGTRGAVARQVAAAAELFSWFPYEKVAAAECPLDAVGLGCLAKAGEDFPDALGPQLKQNVGVLELPSPPDFARLCRDLADVAQTKGDQQKLQAAFASQTDEAVALLAQRLAAIQTHSARAARTLGALTDQVVSDLLLDRGENWKQLATRSKSLLSDHRSLIDAVDGLHFTLPELSDSEMAGLADSIEKRRVHFEKGGRRGWWVFAPAVVRETAIVMQVCRVNGRPAKAPSDLFALSCFTRLQGIVSRLEQAWPIRVSRDVPIAQVVSHWDAHSVALSSLIEDVAGILAEWKATGAPHSFEWLANAKARSAWQQGAHAESSRRNSARSQGVIDELIVGLNRELVNGTPHSCLKALLAAVTERDPAAYAQVFDQRQQVIAKKEAWVAYSKVYYQLEAACPGLGQLFHKHLHDSEWQGRARQLTQAWHWAIARREGTGVAGADPVRDLTHQVHRLQEQIEQATSELVTLQSWGHFFDRLDPKVRANLVAWQGTIRRIGQGTGQHANLHRREARKYLSECIPAIPVWVMPIHKLWDTVRAEPALFDTIIIDEASQAGIDALPLLMLGKKIIVVGDDMQNSPESVGINVSDVQRLIEQHLGDFHFGPTFALTSSLFDHAYRTFASQVTLREHFRCVPEIIRFSNRFYDPPLIPLRQVPAAQSRLPALKTVFVEGGVSEGSNAAIRNDTEADEIVKTIQWMVGQVAYENKTIGVIALQGRSQAERIARKLAAVLSPQVIEERRIRCGESANFQGDQRDVMLLSLVIGPNQQYMARTTLADQRRYNVAMSRARDQVWLFHSVRTDELSPNDLRYQLLTFFRQPNVSQDSQLDIESLRRASRGPREIGTAPAPFESWFELDVCLALMDRGLFVKPQVEVAYYRIDLVVEGSTAMLAVECDGDYWHGPEQYTADMARQRQLERAGWTFSRVREAAFYADKEKAIAAVLEACEDLGIAPWVAPIDEEESADSEHAERVAEDADEGNATEEDNSLRGQGDEECKARASDEGVSAEPEDEVVPEVRDDDVPFSGYSDAKEYPDPREAAPANVRECLKVIISQDGPLMYSSVYQLYAQACPAFHRCGRGVKAKLNVAIGALIKAGVVVRETEMESLGNDSRVLRLANTPKYRVRSAGHRDILEIPPLELMAVLDEESLRSTDTDSYSERELAYTLLRRYDGRNMTHVRQTYLFSVVREWKQRVASDR